MAVKVYVVKDSYCSLNDLLGEPVIQRGIKIYPTDEVLLGSITVEVEIQQILSGCIWDLHA